jgi:hypothetical protein
MDKIEFVPSYVYDTFNTLFESVIRPNSVKTRNITSQGLTTLMEKGTVVWSNSLFDQKHYYLEGVIRWSKNQVLIYFQKVENESTYKINILTDDLSRIDILLVGLNKFFTIDNI